MPARIRDPLTLRIVWKANPDPLYPYVADVEGEQYFIRLNDFPDDHLYTLMIDGREAAQFDDWPTSWRRP